MDDGIEIPYLAPIVQHPSTPQYGFDIHDEDFQKYLPIVVDCMRAVLLAQKGIHHPLIDAFNESK